MSNKKVNLKKIIKSFKTQELKNVTTIINPKKISSINQHTQIQENASQKKHINSKKVIKPPPPPPTTHKNASKELFTKIYTTVVGQIRTSQKKLPSAVEA